MSTAALSLAAIYLAIWTRHRHKPAYLCFAVAAFSIAATALLENATLHASSAAEFATLVRWFHVPMLFALVSLVWFVRLQFTVGRLWLAILFVVTRLASLVANFATGVNLQYTEITALQPFSLLGAKVIAPIGLANPWMLLGQASMLVLVVFLVDAAIQLRRERQGEELKRATRTVSAIVASLLVGTGYTGIAVVFGPLPLMVVPAFVAVLVVAGYELSSDVARSHELADSLQASELRMDLAGEKTMIGQWSYCPAAGQWTGSAQARILLGLGPDEAPDGEKLWSIMHADDIPGVGLALEESKRNSGQFAAEFRVPDGDGGVRWLMAVGRYQDGPERVHPMVHGLLLDFTERRQLEERFRRVVQASPAAMLVVEKDGRIVFANEQAERIFGYSHDQLCQLNVDALVPPASRVLHAGEREAYARQGEMRPMGGGERELFGIHRDGHELPLEIGISSIPSDHGLQFLATITDISARKAMERESAMQREELAHLSRVALLSELSGSLAHELNQPLTAILSNAQAAMRYMAHSPPNLDEVRESLANIVESDKRAGEVIRRLRAMLRKDPPEFQRLDANEVIEDVLRIIRSDLLNRNVAIRLEQAQTLPLIDGDRVQLQQVMLNLIMNGSDAMSDKKDGRVLTLRTHVSPAGGVEVQVSDVGKGIPESDLERIFLPFVTTKGDGMGLGLAVCTTIVQAHRGRLWATSNTGPGTTLHLELPSQSQASG